MDRVANNFPRLKIKPRTSLKIVDNKKEWCKLYTIPNHNNQVKIMVDVAYTKGRFFQSYCPFYARNKLTERLSSEFCYWTAKQFMGETTKEFWPWVKMEFSKHPRLAGPVNKLPK